MYARPLWRPILLVALAAGMAGCASQAPDAVATGAPLATSTSTAPESTTGSVAPPTTGAASPTTGGPTTTPPATTSTLPGTASGASPVPGLSAADLRAAVVAPSTGARARLSGPVAEQVRLPSGASVWRVRLPGAFPVRNARVAVLIEGRRVGQGVVGPRLRSLVVVTRSGAGLRTGASVAYRWDGSAPVSAGRLTVVR